MQSRLGRAAIPFVLIFLGLAARLLYLGTAGPERLAAAAGVELELFHQAPEAAGSQAVPAAEGPGRTPVPALAGKTYREAGEALTQSGLLMEAKGDPDGAVARQEPAPGSLVGRGTSVKVWLQADPQARGTP